MRPFPDPPDPSGSEAERDSLAVSLRSLRFRYPGASRDTLDLSGLDVPVGQRLALLGSSGSGKSTLLRVMAGLLAREAGDLSVLGQRVTDALRSNRTFQRQTAMVFQDHHLIERASAYENVLHGRLGHAPPALTLLGWFRPVDHLAAETALLRVGLADFKDRSVRNLSGGQRQRVGVARALAQEPGLILADEPVSSLDQATAEGVLDVLCETSAAAGATLVLSLHQPELARRYADTVCGLRNGRIRFILPSGQLTDSVLQDLYSPEELVA